MGGAATARPGQRHARWLWLGGLALVAGLVFGVLLPIYSDEVVWRFAERAAIDGFDKLSADTCGPNTLAVPPWFMWPVRWFSARLNLAFADPLYVRLSGVAYALALVALLHRLAGRLMADADRRATLRALGFGLLALGVMPLLLVLSRPEQPILLCLVGALTIAAQDWRAEDDATPARAATRAGAILLLAIVALSYHMKATLLAPVFALAMLTCARGRTALVLRLLGVAALVGLTLVAAHYWAARFACPDDPVMARNITSQNISALLLAKGNLAAALTALARNANLFAYFDLATPDPRPIAPWLPRDALSHGQMAIWRVPIYAAWLLAIATALAVLVRGVWRCVAARRWQPRLAMAVVIFGLTLVWGVTQTAKNVYDADFMLPLWLLASWLALTGTAEDAGDARLWRWLRGLALAAGAAGTLSVTLLAATYGPAFLRASAERDLIPGMAYSIPAFHYDAARADILGAARACHLPANRRLVAPMVDENSYFALMGAYRPQFHLGVVGVWHGGIKDPLAYLSALHSDGALLACRNLPQRLRARAHAVGDFCCLAPPW